MQVRWYERERWPYRADRKTVDDYAGWVNQVAWQLFCTFTFAWEVSDQQADEIFAAFINELELFLKCNVGYVRGDEKTFSGCGKPASGRHFHALMTSEAKLSPAVIETLWMSKAGNGKDHAGAHVELYDGNPKGASYVLKFINRQHGDWTFEKLHLFLPSTDPTKLNKRQRKALRRHHARLEQSQCCNQLQETKCRLGI